MKDEGFRKDDEGFPKDEREFKVTEVGRRYNAIETVKAILAVVPFILPPSSLLSYASTG
jgi:hypothetical protein